MGDAQRALSAQLRRRIEMRGPGAEPCYTQADLELFAEAADEIDRLRKLAHTFTVNGKWIDLGSVEELWNEVVELRAEKKRLIRALTDYTQDA